MEKNQAAEIIALVVIFIAVIIAFFGDSGRIIIPPSGNLTLNGSPISIKNMTVVSEPMVLVSFQGHNYTSEKKEAFRYATINEKGETVIEDRILNDIRSNVIRDCDILTCDYTVEISFFKDTNITKDFIDGYLISGDIEHVSVDSIFYERNETRNRTVWLYGDVTKLYCWKDNKTAEDVCTNHTASEPVGNKTEYYNFTIEDTEITGKEMKAGENFTLTIRYKKDTPMASVDIGHTILGQDRKDAAWWDVSWHYYTECVINSSVGTNLTHFPARCQLNTSAFISAGEMQADCDDLRVINATNDTLLDYEIENETCNTTNTIIWTRVPNLLDNSTTTAVYLYYGNPTATNAENASGVWQPGGYWGVWHMGSYSDSSGRVTTDLVSTNIAFVNGTGVGFGQALNITNGQSVTNLGFTAPIPVWGESAWVVFRPQTTAHASIAGDYQTNYRGGSGLGRYDGSGGIFDWDCGTSTFAEAIFTTMQNNTLYFLAGFRNSTTYRSLIHNDTVLTSTSNCGVYTTINVNITMFAINRSGYSALSPFTNGTIDEIRFHNTTRTTDWMLAEYGQTYSLEEEQQYWEGWCYQENATVATSCGGLDNGTYWTGYSGSWEQPAVNAVDDNWGTYANTYHAPPTYDGRVFINYSIPEHALPSSLWQVKVGNDSASAYYNVSIPQACWDYGMLRFEFSSMHVDYLTQSYGICYNTTGWHPTIFFHVDCAGSCSDSVDAFIYEEAMWWNISYEPELEFQNISSLINNGSWVTHNATNPMRFRCSLPSANCEPVNQIAASSAAALLAKNNLTSTVTYLSLKSNVSFDASYKVNCSTSNTLTSSKAITTSYVNLSEALSIVPNDNQSIYCWLTTTLPLTSPGRWDLSIAGG